MISTDLKHRPLRAISIAMIAFLLTACATSPREKPVAIEAVSAPTANFSAYQTYYVLDVPPGDNDVAPPKPFSRVVVETAVRRELDARNYREIDDKDAADILVAIQFSLQDETRFKEKTTYDIQQTVYSDPYSRAGYGSGYGRSYGVD